MENNTLKKVLIKNRICYYFDGIIKFGNFDFNRWKITRKYIALVYGISYKTLVGAKPLHIRFDEINGFIRVYDKLFV